jgi:hypothetical protein
MATIQVQDRNTFETLSTEIMTMTFYSRGYPLDDDNDGTAIMNAFKGGKVLDMLMMYRCINNHANPSLERITADAQCYNTKKNLTTRNMQMLLFPAEVIAVINSVDIMQQ